MGFYFRFNRYDIPNTRIKCKIAKSQIENQNTNNYLM